MKICPKCNKEWPDDYMACPLDGTDLISKPQQPSGFNLNLGEAGYISGGVNMSDNHSVSNNTVNTTTSNVDSHNVITNNITQVEREKRPEELKHEKELAFREECLRVYSNGIMTSEGKRKLDDLRYHLGLDENSAIKILSEVAKRSERKSSSLSPVHQITYNNIKTAINANRLDLVNRLMAQMKVMAQRYSSEEIQFTYYMLQAVLHPKKCLEEFEGDYVDKYWQTFWSSIAYRRLGNIEQSERRSADVGDKWTDTIPQENTYILASVNALIDKDIKMAKSLFDNISGDHSPYLESLKNCIYTLLYGDMLSADELKKMQKDGAFYTSNLFSEINTYNQEQKRLQEEAEAKRIAEEKKRQEEAEAKRLAEERKRQKEVEAKRLAEEKKKQEESEAKLRAEELTKQVSPEQLPQFSPQLLSSFVNDFGYLRELDPSEIAELKSMLLSAPEDNNQAQFLLGQLFIQEKTSASNLRLAYNAIKTASEHGVYEAGAYMAYFYLYGKVVSQDLDEAERRIKIDDDYKKNPIFVQMLVDLYNIKGNTMLADVWKSKLCKLK